jgi:hypothetical protein
MSRIEAAKFMGKNMVDQANNMKLVAQKVPYYSMDN